LGRVLRHRPRRDWRARQSARTNARKDRQRHMARCQAAMNALTREVRTDELAKINIHATLVTVTSGQLRFLGSRIVTAFFASMRTNAPASDTGTSIWKPRLPAFRLYENRAKLDSGSFDSVYILSLASGQHRTMRRCVARYSVTLPSAVQLLFPSSKDIASFSRCIKSLRKRLNT